MTIGVYTREGSGKTDTRLDILKSELSRGGCELYTVDGGAACLRAGTDLLLAVGGDGTFLMAAAMVGESGVPIAGVNTGRLGFLSENRPEDIADAILSRNYSIERRTMERVSVDTVDIEFPYALNEVSVHRTGPSMLGIDVSIDGEPLPAYWADGLIIATASGSTAYSLAVGGPIVMPSSRVLIISPIAPHNLNVRPMVIPDTSSIALSFRSRDDRVTLSTDNRAIEISSSSKLEVKMAHFSLNRVRVQGSSFINALTSKLFWGEDIRNGI